jgi:transcriptional regulator with XRE-family HTH domain
LEYSQEIIYRLEYIWRIAQMFTEKFMQIMQEKRITAYQVAKHTGIPQGSMNRYKNGERLPTLENLIKIADYLDVSTDYLLGRTDVPEVNRKV